MTSAVLNVRQIAQYPAKVPGLDDLVLLQTGGLGGPYASALVSDLIRAAFDSGAQFQFQMSLPPDGVIGWGTDANSQILYGGALGGALGFSPSAGWRFDYANPERAVTLMRLGPDGNLTLERGTVSAARAPAFPQEVVTLDFLQRCGVTSFNGRHGDVQLGSDDVYRALGLHGTAASQEWVNAAITASLAAFQSAGRFVYSFNGRIGAVTLTADDITAAATAPGAQPRANSPALGDAGSRIATTLFVDESLADLEQRLLGEIAPPDLSAYALLNSPDFTGIPLAPTANPGTSTGQLATTAFVHAAVSAATAGVASFNGRTGSVTLLIGDVTGVGGAPLSSPNLTGTPLAPTASPGTSTAQIATTAFVQAAIGAIGSGVVSFNGRTGAVTLVTADVTGAGGAPVAGPTFTGAVRAPTPAPASNDTTVATTAYVTAAVAASTAGVTSFNSRTGAVTLLNADISAAGGALIASPAFTGTPAAPTAPVNTNTTQLATTAFVMNQIAASTGAGVTSFNTRTGAVTLVLADVTGAGGAPVNSPGLTGVPTAPTAAGTSSDTTIATTAFVKSAIASAGGVTSFNSRTGAVTLAGGDVSAAGGALVASPALTGTPTAPTASPGTSTGQIATTAFVVSQITSGAVASFNGRNGAVTLTLADITGAGGAPVASPAFTGTPNAPTQAPGTSDTTIATTAFVQAAAAAAGVTSVTAGAGLTGGGTGAVTLSIPANGVALTMLPNVTALTLLGNNTGSARTPQALAVSSVMTMLGAAPLASPAFTGTPAAPTAAVGTNSTQVATTAFVAAGFLPLAGGTLTGNLTAQNLITNAGTVTVNSPASPAQSAVVLNNFGGATQGSLYWDPTSGQVAVKHFASNQIAYLNSSGVFFTTGGYGTRAGVGAAEGGNVYNFFWTGSALQLWLGSSNVGTLAFTSDYRTKRNVSNLGSMWDRTKRLRPIRYAHRAFGPVEEDNVERWGFIAHELQETLTESAATGIKDQDNMIQSPDPWTVIAALTRAVQEAMVRIEALEAA